MKVKILNLSITVINFLKDRLTLKINKCTDNECDTIASILCNYEKMRGVKLSQVAMELAIFSENICCKKASHFLSLKKLSLVAN